MIGEIGLDVNGCIRAFSKQLKCELIELNVQTDHIHLLVMVPPKVSISDYVGTIKGRTAIRVLNELNRLKQKPYWGNHFWAQGYFVDTVGLDSEMIRKYVKYQEVKERREEQQLSLFKWKSWDNSNLCPLRRQGKSSPSRGYIKAGPSGVGFLLPQSTDISV